MKHRLLIILLALLPLAASAEAQSGPTGFQSPSKNIACQVFTGDKQTMLRCDISAMAKEPRRRADCDLAWGDAFEMAANGTAAPICHGDTVMDPALPVLAYGETWQRGGFTCRSEQTGVTCSNTAQHGFMLSRAEQKVF
ncbi:DUF6636 domain-containing protein [Bradyrhizobium erythrophlei]|uniref:DUF6636 domain-containing protein n=1 Tax=Bradyrhizobium erythrophlei TaxID=1437360 RepID=UPI0035EEF967